MATYIVTITVNVPIEARNDDQADERAERVEYALKLDLSKAIKWVGDMEMTYEVEEA